MNSRKRFYTEIAAKIQTKGQILVVVPTVGDVVDEPDLRSALKDICKAFQGMTLMEWSTTGGFREPGAPEDLRTVAFEAFLDGIKVWKRNPIVVMVKNGVSVMNNLSPASLTVAMQMLQDHNEAMKGLDPSDRRFVQLVFVDRTMPEVPIGQVECKLPVPERDRLRNQVTKSAEMGQVPPFDVERVLDALVGLPSYMADDALAGSVAATGGYDVQFLIEEKARHLAAAGLVVMNTTNPDGSPMTIDSIGGLENLKKWILEAQVGFSDRNLAAEYGLPTPRGVLLCGVPGTGKSAIAKGIAGTFNAPLVQFTSVMSKYLGDAEENLRKRLRILDALDNIVVLFDEVADMFGRTDGESDGGASGRVQSELLTWLQEHKSNVFVVMTANEPEKLPPQLTRQGRIDQLFALLAPTMAELRSIIEVLKRRYRKAAGLDTEALIGAAAGHVGAEIEAAIVQSLRAALATRSEITTEQVVAALVRGPKVAETFDPTGKIKSWMATACLPASIPDTGPDASAPRKVGRAPLKFGE